MFGGGRILPIKPSCRITTGAGKLGGEKDEDLNTQ